MNLPLSNMNLLLEQNKITPRFNIINDSFFINEHSIFLIIEHRFVKH